MIPMMEIACNQAGQGQTKVAGIQDCHLVGMLLAEALIITVQKHRP
jgi:hypothetical protein